MTLPPNYRLYTGYNTKVYYGNICEICGAESVGFLNNETLVCQKCYEDKLDAD